MINRWFLELWGATTGDCRALCSLEILETTSNLCRKAERETKGHPEVGRGCRSAKEPETSPAESVLRVTPATQEQGPRDQCRNPEGGAWNRVTVLICLYPPARKQEHHRPSLQQQAECKYCTSSTTGRGSDRERCKESASVIGGTGRRSATSAQPGNPREPGFYWRSSGTPGQVNASTAFFI